jgi:hypothetical protein
LGRKTLCGVGKRAADEFYGARRSTSLVNCGSAERDRQAADDGPPRADGVEIGRGVLEDRVD